MNYRVELIIGSERPAERRAVAGAVAGTVLSDVVDTRGRTISRTISRAVIPAVSDGGLDRYAGRSPQPGPFNIGARLEKRRLGRRRQL
ncbi:hypothetical protein C3E77_12780 [Mycetocola zhujimingii]|nr:hypothetical protein C3E77_12780 [Mycetocola zhujimingii]